jgi:hypothetical protein
MKEGFKKENIHFQSGLIVDMIIKSSLLRNTLDNVTCLFVGFTNYENCFNNSFNIEEKEIKSDNKLRHNYKLSFKNEINKFQSNKELTK